MPALHHVRYNDDDDDDDDSTTRRLDHQSVDGVGWQHKYSSPFSGTLHRR
jgi:hypothetical protein